MYRIVMTVAAIVLVSAFLALGVTFIAGPIVDGSYSSLDAWWQYVLFGGATAGTGLLSIATAVLLGVDLSRQIGDA